MNKKWISIAADFLERASDEFSNHSCNDWSFPKDWTKEEKQDLNKKMYEDNGDPENFNPKYLNIPDWWVMSFLAKQLKLMSKT